MKTRIIITSAILGVGLLIGCSEFRDVQPVGNETLEMFFKNEEQAGRAVTAVYDVLGWENSQEINEWVLGDICSDDAAKGGYGLSDHPEWEQLKRFVASPSNPVLFRQWSEMYQGIYRANLCIENISKKDCVIETEDLKDRYIAEVTFLRAYFYFNLVKVFGGVPLVTTVLDESEYDQPRAPVDSCWKQIEDDLIAAAAVLPEKGDYEDADMGRATKGAANALLLKAYIYQKKWADAEEIGQEIIASGEYDLEPNYRDIFTLEHENGMESVFEVQHIVDPSDGWADENEGQETSIFQTGIDNSYPWDAWGWGFVNPTEDLVNEYEEHDPRLGATIIAADDTLYTADETGEDPILAVTDMSETGYMSRKYLIEYGVEANESNSPSNWRVIRYADVLLMTAEAANENGNTADALLYLNMVRERAKNSIMDTTGIDMDSVLVPVTVNTKSGIRNAIYHERRVELALEGIRFFDLLRQERAETILEDNGFIAPKNYLFPIPAIEMALSPALEQNPGY